MFDIKNHLPIHLLINYSLFTIDIAKSIKFQHLNLLLLFFVLFIFFRFIFFVYAKHFSSSPTLLIKLIIILKALNLTT